MRHIIVVRHAAPAVQNDQPPSAWPLSSDGALAAEALAHKLAQFQINALWASDERKAIETAAIIGRIYNLPTQMSSALCEHQRHNAGYLARPAFEAAMERFFAQPNQRVFGDESAAAARARFAAAVQTTLISNSGARDMVIVTHGTVMSLYLAPLLGHDPMAFWRALPMPAYVALTLPGLRLASSDHPSLRPSAPNETTRSL